MYFKYIFRKCKTSNTRKVVDSLANNLFSKNERPFWKEIKKVNSDKKWVAVLANNCRGEKNITDMWKNHFDRLLNSACDNRNRSQSLVLNTLKSNSFLFTMITIVDVINAIQSIIIAL